MEEDSFSLGPPPPPPQVQDNDGLSTDASNHQNTPPPKTLAPVVPALLLKSTHGRLSPASSPSHQQHHQQRNSGRPLNASISPHPLTTPHVQYRVLERLGKGSSGSVYKAIHKETGVVVALKKVAVEDMEDVIQEITIMKNCESLFIIRYFEHYVYDDYLWIAMEYCPTGSVTDLMRLLPNKILTERQIAAICKSVLSGLLYLHQSKKVHRDVKPENILITDTGSVKLADFGIASQLSTITYKKVSVVGTPYFMAPEVALYSGGYDSKADIWSLGISAIDMAQSEPPRFEIPPSKVIWMIPHLPPPTLKNTSGFSPAFNHFLAYCLMKEPTDRPTAEQVLQHPFIQDAIDAQEALADLLKEVNEIIARDGGLERALKKSKIREKQAREIEQQEKQKQLQQIAEKQVSENQSPVLASSFGIDKPRSPSHAALLLPPVIPLQEDKPKKKERKKRIIKVKLAHFFQRRPKKEDLMFRGILGELDPIVGDFGSSYNLSPSLTASPGPSPSPLSISLVSPSFLSPSPSPSASPISISSPIPRDFSISPLVNHRFSHMSKPPLPAKTPSGSFRVNDSHEYVFELPLPLVRSPSYSSSRSSSPSPPRPSPSPPLRSTPSPPPAAFSRNHSPSLSSSTPGSDMDNKKNKHKEGKREDKKQHLGKKEKKKGNGCIGEEAPPPREKERNGGKKEEKKSKDKEKKDVEKVKQQKERRGSKYDVGVHKERDGGEGETPNGEEGEKEDKTNKKSIATMFSTFMKRRESQSFHASM